MTSPEPFKSSAPVFSELVWVSVLFDDGDVSDGESGVSGVSGSVEIGLVEFVPVLSLRSPG